MIFNSLDAIFWGAFLGAFFSFWFYVLGYYLPKGVKKVYLKFKRNKIVNQIYELLLLKRDSEYIVYDLRKKFLFDGLENFLKANVLESFDRVQFENENLLITIRINYDLSEFTMRTSKNYGYGLGTRFKEENLDILFEFIEYFERRCKEEDIKLKITELLKKARQ